MLKVFGNRNRSFFLLLALAAPMCLSSAAQSQEGTPHLPPAPQPAAPSSVPFGAVSAENYSVSSSANEHGSYVWIVAPIQHVVVLCEKLDTGKDFTCNMKRLP